MKGGREGGKDGQKLGCLDARRIGGVQRGGRKGKKGGRRGGERNIDLAFLQVTDFVKYFHIPELIRDDINRCASGLVYLHIHRLSLNFLFDLHPQYGIRNFIILRLAIGMRPQQNFLRR